MINARLVIPIRHSLFALLFCSCWAQGHHSVAATYDQTTQVIVEMRVTEFRFAYPHPSITGELVAVASPPIILELDNKWELDELGFAKDTFQVGDRILVTLYPSRYDDQKFYLAAFDHPRLGFRYQTNVRRLFKLAL